MISSVSIFAVQSAQKMVALNTQLHLQWDSALFPQALNISKVHKYIPSLPRTKNSCNHFVPEFPKFKPLKGVS